MAYSAGRRFQPDAGGCASCKSLEAGLMSLEAFSIEQNLEHRENALPCWRCHRHGKGSFASAQDDKFYDRSNFTTGQLFSANQLVTHTLAAIGSLAISSLNQ